MGSGGLQSDELSQYIIQKPGLRVLVVDGDAACLAIASKILRTLGYEVVTARLASDALSIVQEKKNELHLVLMEVHMPDMGRYELIEKMRESCKLPFFIMSADNKQISMEGALAKGAEKYFIKPVMIADLRGLWQFARRQRNDKVIASENVPGFVGDESEGNMGNRRLPSAKRKEPELFVKDERGETVEPLRPQKKKFIWTIEMRKRFMESYKQLGTNARPKKILEHMNMPGLTKEIVSSYLQNYRKSLKREEKTTQNVVGDSSNLHSGSNRQSLANNLPERCLPFLEQQRVIHQPNLSTNCQKDSRSFASKHFLGPAHFPSLEILTGQELNSRQNQSILLCNIQGIVAPTTPVPHEVMINGNGEAFAGSRQAENATGGENFKSDTFLSYVGYISGGNEMEQLFPQHLLLPVPLLPSEGEQHNILEAETDEVFDFPKGAQQFNDEDLNLWLTSL